MSKIESFEETQAKFSIIPNSIFDILASADLNPYETKILVIIARNTYGWRADFDEISVSQFMGSTEDGRATMSKPTVLKSLKSLEEKGLILSCLFVVNNVQKKVYFINTDESAKMVELIKSGAIKYSELKSYRLHKIANQKSSFNLVNHFDRVNHVDGGSQSPLPGGSTTLTGVVNHVDGGSQSPLPTKNNLKNNLNTEQTAARSENVFVPESVEGPLVKLPRQDQPKQSPAVQDINDPPKNKADAIVQRLMALGFGDIESERIYNRYREQVEIQLDWLPHRNPEKPRKMLMLALSQNWEAPKSVVELQAEEKRKEAPKQTVAELAKIREAEERAKAERNDPNAQARARAAIEEIKRMKVKVAS